MRSRAIFANLFFHFCSVAALVALPAESQPIQLLNVSRPLPQRVISREDWVLLYKYPSPYPRDPKFPPRSAVAAAIADFASYLLELYDPKTPVLINDEETYSSLGVNLELDAMMSHERDKLNYQAAYFIMRTAAIAWHGLDQLRGSQTFFVCHRNTRELIAYGHVLGDVDPTNLLAINDEDCLHLSAEEADSDYGNIQVEG